MPRPRPTSLGRSPSKPTGETIRRSVASSQSLGRIVFERLGDDARFSERRMVNLPSVDGRKALEISDARVGAEERLIALRAAVEIQVADEHSVRRLGQGRVGRRGGCCSMSPKDNRPFAASQERAGGRRNENAGRQAQRRLPTRLQREHQRPGPSELAERATSSRLPDSPFRLRSRHSRTTWPSFAGSPGGSTTFVAGD